MFHHNIYGNMEYFQYFSIYWVSSHPNLCSYFYRGGEDSNQIRFMVFVFIMGFLKFLVEADACIILRHFCLNWAAPYFGLAEDLFSSTVEKTILPIALPSSGVHLQSYE